MQVGCQHLITTSSSHVADTPVKLKNQTFYFTDTIPPLKSPVLGAPHVSCHFIGGCSSNVPGSFKGSACSVSAGGRQLRVSMCLWSSHPHLSPSSSKLILHSAADGVGASMAVPPAAPVVMNDCMALGIKLDQCNPLQHMQPPEGPNPACRRTSLLIFPSQTLSKEARRC